MPLACLACAALVLPFSGALKRSSCCSRRAAAQAPPLLQTAGQAHEPQAKVMLCCLPLCPAVPADKTIFEWQAMTEDEQRARLEQIRLEVAAYGEDEEVV